MKIGFLTACLPKVGLEELARWAGGQGFTALELAAWPVSSDRDYQARQIDAAKFTKGDANRIRDLLAEHGLAVSAMAYYDNNLDPDPAVRKHHHDHLKKVIRAAELLGVGLVGTQHAARGQHAGCGGDAGGIQRLELGDIIQDSGELLAVARFFPICQVQARQVSDMFDFFDGQAHAGDYN